VSSLYVIVHSIDIMPWTFVQSWYSLGNPFSYHFVASLPHNTRIQTLLTSSSRHLDVHNFSVSHWKVHLASATSSHSFLPEGSLNSYILPFQWLISYPPTVSKIKSKKPGRFIVNRPMHQHYPPIHHPTNLASATAKDMVQQLHDKTLALLTRGKQLG
jgi:hypothetical protein